MKIIIVLLTSLLFSTCCLNPDCEFTDLYPPIILVAKNKDHVICIDKHNTIWSSSTNWYVARLILEGDFRAGDTIIFNYQLKPEVVK